MPMFLVLLDHAIGDPIPGAHGFKLGFQVRPCGGSVGPMDGGLGNRGIALAGIGIDGLHGIVHKRFLFGLSYVLTLAHSEVIV